MTSFFDKFSFNDLPYREITIVFSIIVYVFETYLHLRQQRTYHIKVKPNRLNGIVKDEDFARAQAYNLDKSVFSLWTDSFHSMLNLLILWYNGLPYLWSASADLMARYGYTPDYEIVHSLVFVILGSIFNFVISLPFSLYSTFVIEEKHGFNKSTLGLFITDTIKSIFISALLGLPLLAAFIKIVQWGGPNFYFYVCVFLFSVQMIMVTIYPVLIQPLFNKVEPLPEGELRTNIESLAKQIKFPLKHLYTIDGSKRSGHSNAYFYGLCHTKHIVLYDTLIAQSTTSQVVAILGHELGHWKLWHNIRMLLLSQIHMFALFYCFAVTINHSALYHSYGFTTQPILIGFILFSYLISPFEHLFGFLLTLLSRVHEFQADAFSVNLGYGQDLKDGLIKLHNENLSTMLPDPLYSAYHYSHPPLLERLSAIDAKMSKQEKKST